MTRIKTGITRFYRTRSFEALLFLAFFSLPFIIYFNLLINNQSFVAGDGVQFFSTKIFLGNSLKSGDFPLWNPYLSAGIPFALDATLNAYYPVSILLSLLPADAFIFSFYGFHLAIGGLFMFKYLQELRCSRFISLITSVIYVFSINLGGFRKEHMCLIATAVWLPVILFLIQKYLNTKRLGWLIGSAVAMALQFTIGFMQYVVYGNIVIFIYLLSWGDKREVKLKKILRDGFAWGVTYIGLIAIQLLPTLQLLDIYKSNGSSDTPFSWFTGLSLSPVKLIMMVFPRFFGDDVYMPLSDMGNYTSGLDAELFVGILVAGLIIFGILYARRRFIIRLSLGIMIGTFIYACIGQFPFLAKILYKIPVLNGFRVPSRTVFIFVFFCYVVFAVALTELQRYDMKKKLHKLNIISASAFAAVILLRLFVVLREGETALSVFQSVFFIPAVVFIIYLLYFYLFRNRLLSPGVFYRALAVIICVTTIIQVFPYYTCANSSSADSYTSSDSSLTSLKESVGYEKVLLDGYNDYNRYLDFNVSASSSIYTLNSYIAFNNPLLYKLLYNATPQYNSSALYTQFQGLNSLLTLKNDVFSMLGIKYIVAKKDSLDLTQTVSLPGSESTQLFAEDSLSIPASENGATYSYAKAITIKPNTYYKFSFDVDSQGDQSFFYVDLYNTDSIQLEGISVKEGENSFIGSLYSGDNSGTGYFRIVTVPSSGMGIKDLTVSEVTAVAQENVYTEVSTQSDATIYENLNAKDILYAPQRVESVSDFSNIYSSPENYALSDISYVEGLEDEDLSDADTSIEVKSFTDNQITATVSSDKDTFINFSQCYYPGWNAYVDGIKVNVYMVNGLIQGASVLAGSHTLQFRFEPVAWYAGAGITTGTILLLIVCFAVSKKWRPKHWNGPAENVWRAPEDDISQPVLQKP